MDDNRYFKAALAAVVLFILGVVLKLARPVLIPFILAVFLSFIIDPALTFLTRCRCPRPGAVLIVLGLMLVNRFIAPQQLDILTMLGFIILVGVVDKDEHVYPKVPAGAATKDMILSPG